MHRGRWPYANILQKCQIHTKYKWTGGRATTDTRKQRTINGEEEINLGQNHLFQKRKINKPFSVRYVLKILTCLALYAHYQTAY